MVRGRGGALRVLEPKKVKNKRFTYVYEIFNPDTEEVIERHNTLEACKLEFVRWSLRFGDKNTFQYRKVKVRTVVGDP